MSDLRKQPNKEPKQEIAVTGEKLDLRKKMGTITMVTPPSFFQNQKRSFCLINLSKKDKDNFVDQVKKHLGNHERVTGWYLAGASHQAMGDHNKAVALFGAILASFGLPYGCC